MRKTSEAGTGLTHGPHGPANVCRRLKEIIRPVIGSLGGFAGKSYRKRLKFFLHLRMVLRHPIPGVNEVYLLCMI